MTFKNSLLVNLVENNKRRITEWVLSLVAFSVMFPSYAGLELARIYSRMEQYLSVYGAEAKQIMKAQARQSLESNLGISGLSVWVGVFAAICAIHGFSWIYSRQKLDFYLGMPVKRSKRFFVIWLNGMLIFMLPYLLGLIIGLLIALGTGNMTVGLLACTARAYGFNILLYISIYNLAMVAVMLTGNCVISAVALGLFLIYEFWVRQILLAYAVEYFDRFVPWGKREAPVISPVRLFYEMVTSYHQGETGWYLKALWLLGFALAAGLAAFFIYNRRPGDKIGRAICFKSWESPVKILMVVPGALSAGILIDEMIAYGQIIHSGYLFFAYGLAIILGCAFCQVIYEFNIKAFFHKKRDMVWCGVLTVFIFLVFRYDFLDYDGYVPEAEKIESVAMTSIDGRLNGGYFDERGRSLSQPEYVEQNMFFTDGEKLCSLVRLSFEEQKQAGEIAEEKGYESDQLSRFKWGEFYVLYRLKSGRKVTRSVTVNLNNPQVRDLLEQIMNTEEYQQGIYLGASHTPRMLLDKESLTVKASYGNTVYSYELGRQAARELFEAYERDSQKMGFANVYDSVPTGRILLDVKTKMDENALTSGYYSSSVEYRFPVYSFFEETIACLKAYDCYMEYFFDPEEVDRIVISDSGIRQEQLTGEGEQEGDEPVVPPSCTYTEPEEIQKLALYLYPATLLTDSRDRDHNLSAEIYFKDRSQQRDAAWANYLFRAGQVPEFVMRDLQ